MRPLIAEDEGEARLGPISVELAGCMADRRQRDQHRLGKQRRKDENDEAERQ
jgi:hypothetical protein